MRCSPGTPGASAAAARRHRVSDNPLRSHGRLGAACGIEYAAQAMAVHGALVAASAPLASSMARSIRGSFGPGVGYLACVRDVTFTSRASMTWPTDLIASAERVTGDGRSVLYQFSVWSARAPAAQGPGDGGHRCDDRRHRRGGRPAMSAERRRALVTGGSGGIGAALCRRLARDGHYVYVHSRRGGGTAVAGVIADITRRGR